MTRHKKTAVRKRYKKSEWEKLVAEGKINLQGRKGKSPAKGSGRGRKAIPFPIPEAEFISIWNVSTSPAHVVKTLSALEAFENLPQATIRSRASALASKLRRAGQDVKAFKRGRQANK